MDPNIDMETGESIGSGRSPRFSLWTAFLAFSTVVMLSAIQTVSLEETFCSHFHNHSLTKYNVMILSSYIRKTMNWNRRAQVDTL